MTKSPSEPEGWALIPAPAGLPAVPDMTKAQLVEELARLGNNYRRVSPHLSAVIARAVEGLAVE